MEKINWSTDNCTCGYWKEEKYREGALMHGEGCECTIVDNTPNAAKLMDALRTISHTTPTCKQR